MLSRRRDGKGKVQSGRRERREKGIRDPQVRIKKCIFGALLQLIHFYGGMTYGTSILLNGFLVIYICFWQLIFLLH